MITEEEEDLEVVLEEEVVIEEVTITEGLGDRDLEESIINITVICSSLREISEGKKGEGGMIREKVELKRRKWLKSRKENLLRKGWENQRIHMLPWKLWKVRKGA